MAKKKVEKANAKPNRVSSRGRVNEGRPDKYTEIITNKKLMRLLYNMCLLGATFTEMANSLDIHRDTFYEWMKNENGKTKEFSDTIKKGRIEADARVGKALFQRAIGYKQKAVKMFAYEGAVITREYIERFPPSEAALNIWLKNRRAHVDSKKDPEGIRWADRHEIDTTSGGEPINQGPQIDYSKLSDKTLRELADAIKQ